jgi:hypothetical protein
MIWLLIIITLAFLILNKDTEPFNIPLRSSSAWDWNLGPGYGAGYGTGYAMWGIWPANLPKEPWKNWMWGRRPLIFTTPFTPMPQIDYNNAPYNSKPISNYNISILPQNGTAMLSVNGVAGQTLQLDRGRNYYFHVYTPGTAFIITADKKTPLIEPIENGMIQINFTKDDPDVLYYMMPGKPASGGVIYLNSTRWI